MVAVRYKLSEDPALLTTGNIPESGSTVVALAPDSRVVAVAVDSSLFLFSSSSGEMMEKLVDVHGGGWHQPCLLPVRRLSCTVDMLGPDILSFVERLPSLQK